MVAFISISLHVVVTGHTFAFDGDLFSGLKWITAITGIALWSHALSFHIICMLIVGASSAGSIYQ
jgi:hypothetical protein